MEEPKGMVFISKGCLQKELMSWFLWFPWFSWSPRYLLESVEYFDDRGLFSNLHLALVVVSVAFVICSLKTNHPLPYGEKKPIKKNHIKEFGGRDAPEASQGQTRDVPGTPGTFWPDVCVNQY